MKLLPILILAVVLLGACSDLGESPGEVYAVVDVQTITINNTTNRPIHVMVLGANQAALTEWIPGCDATNNIPPGSASTRSHSDMKNEGERFAIVYWWNDCREVDGHSLGHDIHALRVALP